MFQNGHTPLKIMLQDFQSVSDHFGTLCIKGLKSSKDSEWLQSMIVNGAT